MKRAIVPTLCFAIGIVCGGIFFAKNSSEPAKSKTGTSHTLGSALPGAPSSHGKTGGSSQGRSNSTTIPGKHTSIDALLDLAGNGYAPGRLVEVYQALAGLDINAVQTLADDLETLPPNDSRTWQLRNSIVTRLAQLDPDIAYSYASSIKNKGVRQQAMSIVLSEIARANLTRALSILGTLDDPEAYRTAAGTIANSSPNASPKALLELLRKRTDVSIDYQYTQLYTNWARKNFPAALAEIATLPNSPERSRAIQGIGGAVTTENLGAALALLESLPNQTERSNFVNNAVQSLAGKAPEKALELLETHGDVSQRRHLLSTIASQWLANDPEAAQPWVESLDPRSRMAALENSAYNIGPENREWFVEQISKLPANNQTSSIINNLANQFGQNDPAGAAKMIASLDTGQSTDWALRNLASRWAQQDPFAAGEFYANQPIRDSNDGNTLGNIAAAMAKQDPDAALAWMNSLEVADDNTRNAITQSMVAGWGVTDPEAAAAFTSTLEGENKINAIASLARSWASNNLEEAQAWVDQLEDPAARNRARASVIGSLTYRDPARAAVMLAEATDGLSVEDQKSGFEGSARNVATYWAQIDPAAAAAWATELPADTVNHGQVYSDIINQWADYEPAAASEWLAGLDQGPTRDTAVGNLVSRISQSDPEGAFAWAESINNEAQKRSAVRQAANNWRNRDPDAARAALQSADITQEFREELLKSIPNK